jgi:hypothetical protein
MSEWLSSLSSLVGPIRALRDHLDVAMRVILACHKGEADAAAPLRSSLTDVLSRPSADKRFQVGRTAFKTDRRGG